MSDLDHPHHQTKGDCVLEQEMLDLFSRESDGVIDWLQLAKSGREPREAAHLLDRSASLIGAQDMARISRRVETAEPDDADIRAASKSSKRRGRTSSIVWRNSLF